MQRKAKAKRHSIYILLFQLCVIADSILGDDAEFYIISRGIMLLFFAGMLFRIMSHGGKIQISRSLLLPFVFLLYMTLSLIWSYNRELAFAQYITEIQLFILFFFTYYCMREEGKIEDYLWAVYISGFLMAAYALYKYGGFSGYTSIMQTGRRLGGEIANENTFGQIFANASLIALYLAIMKGKRIHYLSLVIFLFFGFSSGSKKFIFLVAAGVVGIALIHFGLRRIYKTLIGSAVLLYAGTWALQLPMFSTINKRFQSYISGNLNKSDVGRKEMIRFGIDLFKQRPVFGYGLNNYRHFYNGYYSHNNFVELLACLGLVGFVLYYAMYFDPVVFFIRQWIRKSITFCNEHKMLLFLLGVNLVFGYGMVQVYDKQVWLLLGVAIAAKDSILKQQVSEV